MKIGKYDQRIEFFKEGIITDGNGDKIPSDITILKTFARVKQIPQGYSLEQVEKRLQTAYRVGVHYRESLILEVGTLIKWRGKKFQIITAPTINDVRRQREFIFDIAEV